MGFIFQMNEVFIAIFRERYVFSDVSYGRQQIYANFSTF